MGVPLLSLVIHEKQMAKKLKEVYAGKFFVKYHNTWQEYSYCEFTDDVHMVIYLAHDE